MTVDQLFDKHYYSRRSFLDGTTAFHNTCRRFIPRGSCILEVGAGPTNRTSSFLSSCGTVTGVDIDLAVLANTALTAAHVYDGHALPFPDASFDACVSNFVLEHVEFPEMHFREVARVLKSGGVYCFRTPNLSHYVSSIAHVTPQWVHRRVANWARRLPAEAHEPYPTFHRVNSRSAVTKLIHEDWEIVELTMLEPEPSYARFSRLAFYLGLGYERLVNRFSCLQPFRATIVSVLRRPMTVPHVSGCLAKWE